MVTINVCIAKFLKFNEGTQTKILGWLLIFCKDNQKMIRLQDIYENDRWIVSTSQCSFFLQKVRKQKNRSKHYHKKL